MLRATESGGTSNGPQSLSFGKIRRLLCPMEKIDGTLLLSASDLVGHLSCRHLTILDAAVANEALKKPAVWDSLLEILWERGAAHEKRYIEHLKSSGFPALRIEGSGLDDKSVQSTCRDIAQWLHQSLAVKL